MEIVLLKLPYLGAISKAAIINIFHNYNVSKENM